MMRALPYLLLIGAVMAGVVWVVQRAGPRRALRLGSDEAGSPAVLAYGPGRGPGTLRLTGTQLVFSSDAGRMLVIERLDLVGVGVTRDLPDRRTAAAVLVLTTLAEVLYFQVEQPEQWVRRLT